MIKALELSLKETCQISLVSKVKVNFQFKINRILLQESLSKAKKKKIKSIIVMKILSQKKNQAAQVVQTHSKKLRIYSLINLKEIHKALS